MMAPKTKRKDLEPPEAVRKHWEEGNKKEMAELLRDLNFDRDPSTQSDRTYINVDVCIAGRKT